MNTGASHTDPWWGYAEADSTIVGILVATFAALAVVYVIVRLSRSRSPGQDRSRRPEG